MYSEFIIDINKSHQYEEVGDRNCGVTTAKGKWLQDTQVWKAISVTAKSVEPSFIYQKMRGEKGKWKT
jgi:hypothetical protein